MLSLHIQPILKTSQQVFNAQGNGVTVTYIIKKGSACVEAFHDVTERISKFFGNPDRSRWSKEVSFQEDLCVLVEDIEWHGLHQENPKIHPILAPWKVSKKKPDVSAIVDVQVTGTEIWLNGKCTNFMKSTMFDLAVGYPITTNDHDTWLDSGTVFDNASNPLEHDSYDDVHADEDDESVGSLGGGGEYLIGEIILWNVQLIYKIVLCSLMVYS